MSVMYEWVIEELDMPADSEEEFEILSVNHEQTYEQAVRTVKMFGCEHYRIGLVRDADDRYGGFNRSWAYVTKDGLPDHLEDAGGVVTASVPKKYRKQYENAQEPVLA